MVGLILISEFEIIGLSVFGLVGLIFGFFGVFVKVGFLVWDGDFMVNNIGVFDDSMDLVYGIGVKFQLGFFVIWVEYEVFEIDNFDFDFILVGVVYIF